MKLVTYLFALALLVMTISGCVSRITPAASNVAIDPSEISKSHLVGENCSKVVLFMFGPFGDTTIKSVLEQNRIKKVTLVDYKLSNYFVLQELCTQVYGY